MRSRYTAFTRGDVAYLEATQIPSLKSDDPNWEETERWSKSVTWLSLQIISSQQGAQDDEAGEVEFVARYLQGASVYAMQERSIFIRREGCWYYQAGQSAVSSTRVERNALCPCGSGRKFKQCHA